MLLYETSCFLTLLYTDIPAAYPVDHAICRLNPPVTASRSKISPAKYNPGAVVKNSLVASGSIINGTVENSVLFKKVYVGNNCVIKNSIILNDVYLGDNTYIENCIVESRDTIRANTRHIGENGVKVVVEKNERYAL